MKRRDFCSTYSRLEDLEFKGEGVLPAAPCSFPQQSATARSCGKLRRLREAPGGLGRRFSAHRALIRDGSVKS